MKPNYAAISAQIARANRPNITDNRQQLDLAGAIDTYFKAQDLKNKNDSNNLLKDAGVALADGNESGFLENLAKADPYKAYSLQQDNKFKQIALNLKQQALNNKNPDMTEKSKNFEYLLGVGYPKDQAAAMAFGGGTETVWDKIGKEKALAAAETEQLYNRNIPEIDGLIKSIEENPDTVGWKSPIKTIAARVTGATPDYLQNRGNVIRKLGTVQNNLIAEAKAAGQSGINTVAEIQQATKGLNENSSPEEVTGALNAMRDSIVRLRKISAVQSGGTDYKSKYGLE